MLPAGEEAVLQGAGAGVSHQVEGGYAHPPQEEVTVPLVAELELGASGGVDLEEDIDMDFVTSGVARKQASSKLGLKKNRAARLGKTPYGSQAGVNKTMG